MKKNYLKLNCLICLIVLFSASAVNPLQAQAPVLVTYSYTGSMQSFTVPSCVGSVTITCVGAAGIGAQNYTPGLGGIAQGVQTVTSGQVLNIFVGGSSSAYNGGGLGQNGSNGGGASDVRLNGITLADRIIVAGGGGGAGGDNWQCSVGTGGGGGGTAVGANFFGGAGGAGYSSGTGCGTNGGSSGGTGGSGTHGGGGGGGGLNSGGGGASSSAGVASSGALGLGGASYNASGCSGESTGGGGGGYYGGGGASGNNCGAGRGGGGSSWTGTLTAPAFTAGTQVNNGYITLLYSFNGNGVAAIASPTAVCQGNSANLIASGMNSYTWSTGAQTSSIVVTPTATTSYTVQGTNSVNCVSSSVLTVTVSSGLPVLSVTTSTNVTCLGKTVTLTATGALSYTWTGGVINGLTYSPTVTQSYTVSGQNGCGTTTAVATITVAPLPISASSTSSIICASNPVTLTAVGPAPAGQFTWTPFPAVLAGTLVIVNPSITTLYTVTASDGTCAGTATLLLTVKPLPTVTAVSSSSMVCAGYPVTITASGGVSYTWSPGALNGPSVTVNPTAPTLYSVSASNSLGCISGTSQVVVTNPSPTISLVATNTFVCAGTSVAIIAGGGSTYLWSNGPTTNSIAVSPTITSGYTVVGTAPNNPCTASRSVTIVVFNPTLTTTGTSTVCSGSNVTLTACCADSYLWDNGQLGNLQVVTPSVNTTYTVTAGTLSNNVTCQTQQTIQVTVNPKPNVSAVSNKTVICRGENAMLTGSGATNYTWSAPNGGAIVGTGVGSTVNVSPTITVIFTYSVTGTDANGCANIATTQLKLSGCTGINSLIAGNESLILYPNPSKGEFVMETTSEITLIISNELGQQLRKIELNENNKFRMQVTDLPSGIYFVTGQNTQGKVNQKILVNR